MGRLISTDHITPYFGELTTLLPQVYCAGDKYLNGCFGTNTELDFTQEASLGLIRYPGNADYRWIYDASFHISNTEHAHNHGQSLGEILPVHIVRWPAR
jgi:hypothetical protein